MRRRRPNQKSMDYKTMTLDEIRGLKIRQWADDEDCLIFMWTIQKYLYESKEILEGWGFNYLVTGVWEKTYGRSAGMPLYVFLWNAEFYLVGYTGRPPLFPKRKLIPLAFSAPNVRHSEKPNIFYDRLLMLDGPRIDIFARKERAGWDVWGDEVECLPSQGVLRFHV